MMLKTVSMLRQSLGLQGVAGSRSPRFLRLVGLLACASVTIITLTPPITPSAQAQELERMFYGSEYQSKLRDYYNRSSEANSALCTKSYWLREGSFDEYCPRDPTHSFCGSPSEWSEGVSKFENICREASQSFEEWLSNLSDDGPEADRYAFGEGGYAQNYAKAVELYRKDGDSIAQYNLGVAYYHGLGVFEDRAEAAEWWSKAALQGHYPSQFYLARAFANGDGVEQDLVAAHVWFNIVATVKGDSNAREARNEIQNSLSPTQRSEALRLAKQCLESEYGDCPDIEGLKRLAQEQAEAEERRLAQEQEQVLKQARTQPNFVRGEQAYRSGDSTTALKYFRPLAESGNQYAQYYLGEIYKSGIGGVAKNRARAIEWYRRAAAQGNRLAQANLEYLQ